LTVGGYAFRHSRPVFYGLPPSMRSIPSAAPSTARRSPRCWRR